MPREFSRGRRVADHIQKELAVLIQQEVKELVKECVDFAEASPFPSPNDLYKDIYEGPYNFIMD